MSDVNRVALLAGLHLSPAEEDELIHLALTLLESRYQPGTLISSPTEVKDLLRLRYAQLPNEIFAALFLDQRHRIIAHEVLFRGTIDGASVHPRVVVQRSLEINAAAVIFCHNHPSGLAEPSSADKKVTERLTEALALVDVRVLDHIVVATGGALAFSELGLL